MPLSFAESGPLPNGQLTVWEEPIDGMSYSAGYDAALGIPGKDSDSVKLTRKITRCAACQQELRDVAVCPEHPSAPKKVKIKEVADLHGHWGNYIIPHMTNLVDAYGAHRVFIVGEAAKEAIPVLRHFYDVGGYWLYYARAESSKNRNVQDKLGHVPIEWDPPVQLLRRMIKADEIEIHDEETHRQLCRFGFRPKSSSTSEEEAYTDKKLTWGAPQGDHDDKVRGLALSLWGHEWLPQFEPPKPKLKPDSIGALLGWDKATENEPAKSRWA